MPGPETDDFAELVEAFNKNKVEFVIIGAHAVAFHGYVRATKDLDILIRPTRENILRVVAALNDFGVGFLGLEEADFTPENVVQIGVPPNRVDLLSEISGVETEKVWETRVKGEYQGRPAQYISRECLLQNKISAGRRQDRLDAEKLEKQAGLPKRNNGRRRRKYE